MRELDFHVDLRLVAVELLRLDQRDLVRRIGHFLDNALNQQSSIWPVSVLNASQRVYRGRGPADSGAPEME